MKRPPIVGTLNEKTGEVRMEPGDLSYEERQWLRAIFWRAKMQTVAAPTKPGELDAQAQCEAIDRIGAKLGIPPVDAGTPEPPDDDGIQFGGVAAHEEACPKNDESAPSR